MVSAVLDHWITKAIAIAGVIMVAAWWSLNAFAAWSHGSEGWHMWVWLAAGWSFAALLNFGLLVRK